MAERIRIEVGFESGAVIGALVGVEAADALDKALEAGYDGAFQLDVEDGRTTIVLRKVVYVKRYAHEARIGFGS